MTSSSSSTDVFLVVERRERHRRPTDGEIMFHEACEVLMGKFGTTLVTGAQIDSIDMYAEVNLRRRMAGGPPLDAEEMPRWTSTLEAKAEEVPFVECQPSGVSAPHRTLEVSLHQPVPLGPPVPLAPTNITVQHSFVHMNLHHEWLHQPLVIDINKSRMVRVNGGPWHGTAQYGHTGGVGGHWTLLFNCKADLSKLKAIKYVQIPGARSFLHVKEGEAAYNSILIPKAYECTPSGAPLRGS